MKRTKLKDRTLPGYTREEEIFSMVTHIVGGAFGIIALILCCIFALIHRNWWGLLSGFFYGAMMIFLYTMSSVYHGLHEGTGKKVLQVLDHCTIYALILGTYAPIISAWLRKVNFKMFIIVVLLLICATAVGVTFTAIDFKKYKYISYSGYFVIGWLAIFGLPSMYRFFGLEFIIWLVAGGLAYTLGMIFFRLGMEKKFMHSIFHIFILAGSILQFIAIFKFCI